MLIPTHENTIVLPKNRDMCRAPSCFAKDLWFELKTWDPSIDKFDGDIMDALIALGVGEKRYPTDGENVAFCIVGGVIAATTGKYLVFSGKASPNDSERINEFFTWEALWNALGNPGEKTNVSFLASILRIFLPRQHDPLIDRPYYQSEFVRRWRALAFPITFSRDLQRICPEHIERGKNAFNRLPPASAEAVQKAAQHFPTMLTIFTEQICLR